ncbi:DUF58 domain-containing protein [Paenibacillus radicis (ex Gao et al. 2016)]|uniref:DUF58 domain-containing protein n=1 Tax=Paenibacillus radicis (ex Gao et al. 2016) TaxID=1737354 RepID=A0A917M7J1_9BACL|nr:DUF58 domain-containing protein [Paenibacillus radicis (ex Gao et al. 2016)]GGG80033.1 hypothetical protein GCM10010918_41440 [Paenibacillus radicis (ex Gao et al. 2016)]
MSDNTGRSSIDAQAAIKLLFPDLSLLARLDQMSVAAGNRVKGTLAGKRRSSSLGGSQEFADYRPYAPGDDIRRLDWNVYGRTGRAYMRQFWDEQELTVNLLVDVSRSMSFGDEQENGKLRFALRLAACIGYASLTGEDRVTARLFGDNGLNKELEPLRGRSSLPQLFQFLGQAMPGPQAAGTTGASGDIADHRPAVLSLAEALDGVKGRPMRSGVTLLITDAMYETGIEEALLRLIAAGQKVVFIHVLSPEELNPSLSGELRLIDSELGSGKDVAIAYPLLAQYKQAVDQYREDLSRLCGERGAQYIFISSADSLTEVINRDLLQRGVLRSKT